MAEEPESRFGKVAAPAAAEPRGAERRKSRRYPCEGFAEVLVLQPETLLRGEVRNVSEHGCFVATRARVHVEPQSEAALRFNLRNRRYRIRAVVANVRPGAGVGFIFRFEDEQTDDEIRCLVEEMNATELRDEAEGRLVRGVGKRPENYVGVRSSR
ncbi:MAG: PilZ domain-containing protein [Terracidiphilus sp.]|nr:PilZ domain-containing protein [Terracidiphilus sp.]